MSFALARRARAELTVRSIAVLRRSLCALLCFALTFSFTAFLVGGPLSDAQSSGLARQDRVEDNDSPTTWLGRWNPRVDKRAVGLDYDWIPQDGFEPPIEELSWIDEPSTPVFRVAHTAEKWRAAPVRGPPV